jgi:glycosyltransferase involved in cell wall biosynthesis
LFIGRLDEVAIPNIEAVLWFCHEVFPEISQCIPDANFIIAGSKPSKKIFELKTDHIEVLADFLNLEDIYSKANCVVLPLLSGGGVKGKLLEAIAFKKLVVTTNHGIEGTMFKEKQHVLLANDAHIFAQYCVDALTNPDQFNVMKNQAFKLLSQEYNWDIIGKKYHDFLVSGYNEVRSQ